MNIWTEQDMMDSGSQTNKKVLELKVGKMVVPMKVFFYKEKNMEKVWILLIKRDFNSLFYNIIF